MPSLPSLPSQSRLSREVDLTSVHSVVRRTMVFIREQYIESGSGDYDGDKSQLQLPAFLSMHKSDRGTTVKGVDGEDRVGTSTATTASICSSTSST
ncbi:unnamed protein product [Closterium sp. Yama58-4]|nr:unnamed protein product [Closterium sp. Yama58-4]